MTELWILRRELFCKSSELGTPGSGICSDTFWYAFRATHSEYLSSCVLSTHWKTVIVWDKSMLSAFCLSSHLSSLCTWAILWTTFSRLITGNMVFYELCSTFCNSYTNLRFWNCCMFWWTCNCCLKRKSYGSTSYSSRLKLYCCSDATIWM